MQIVDRYIKCIDFIAYLHSVVLLQCESFVATICRHTFFANTQHWGTHRHRHTHSHTGKYTHAAHGHLITQEIDRTQKPQLPNFRKFIQPKIILIFNLLILTTLLLLLLLLNWRASKEYLEQKNAILPIRENQSVNTISARSKKFGMTSAFNKIRNDGMKNPYISHHSMISCFLANCNGRTKSTDQTLSRTCILTTTHTSVCQNPTVPCK